MAISNSYSRSAIFLGRGDGTFNSPTEYVSGASFASTRNIYLRDLNNDQQLDLVQVDDNQRHNVLRVRLGAGDGTFAAEESYILAGGVPFVDFADVNKDGAVDAIAGTSAGGFDSSTILFGRVPTLVKSLALTLIAMRKWT